MGDSNDNLIHRDAKNIPPNNENFVTIYSIKFDQDSDG